MAAFLYKAPARGVIFAAGNVVPFRRTASTALSRHHGARPMLSSHWLQNVDGHLSCRWDLADPLAPIPPS
jgi:hypothetical protein